MFHLNENPENRFYLVSVVILASRSLTTDFWLRINFVVDDDCRKRISLAERLVTYCTWPLTLKYFVSQDKTLANAHAYHQQQRVCTTVDRRTICV